MAIIGQSNKNSLNKDQCATRKHWERLCCTTLSACPQYSRKERKEVHYLKLTTEFYHRS